MPINRQERSSLLSRGFVRQPAIQRSFLTSSSSPNHPHRPVLHVPHHHHPCALIVWEQDCPHAEHDTTGIRAGTSSQTQSSRTCKPTFKGQPPILELRHGWCQVRPKHGAWNIIQAHKRPLYLVTESSPTGAPVRTSAHQCQQAKDARLHTHLIQTWPDVRVWIAHRIFQFPHHGFNGSGIANSSISVTLYSKLLR